MTTRAVIKSVLNNFIGTFTSRYSEYDGYWLFGYLIESVDEMVIDLLATDSVPADLTPEGVAASLARSKFIEQMSKSGLALDTVSTARLLLTKHPNSELVVMNGRSVAGFRLTLTVEASLNRGAVFAQQIDILVAPHDPTSERRSVRGCSTET